MDENNFEKIIEKCLKMKEENKSDKEIYSVFPDKEEDIKEIFSILNWLKEEGGKIKPSSQILKNILKKIPEEKPISADVGVGVTKELLFRYNNKSEGRAIVDNTIISQNIIKLKNMKWSIWLSVGVIIVLVVVGIFKFVDKSQEQNIAQEQESSSMINGNENEVFALLEQNLNDEEIIFSEENSEAVSTKTSFDEILKDFNKTDYENII